VFQYSERVSRNYPFGVADLPALEQARIILLLHTAGLDLTQSCDRSPNIAVRKAPARQFLVLAFLVEFCGRSAPGRPPRLEEPSPSRLKKNISRGIGFNFFFNSRRRRQG
jgi:hypothetical protein